MAEVCGVSSVCLCAVITSIKTLLVFVWLPQNRTARNEPISWCLFVCAFLSVRPDPVILLVL